MSIKVPAPQMTAMSKATVAQSAMADMNASGAKQAEANRLFSGGGGGIPVSTVASPYKEYAAGGTGVVDQQKGLFTQLTQGAENAKYDSLVYKKGGSKRKTKKTKKNKRKTKKNKRKTKKNKRKTKNYRKQKRRN